MIRHRPAGRGHPYLVEPDQRVPVRPSAGEPIELRVTTAAGVRGVQAEIERDGSCAVVDATARGPALADQVTSWGARPAQAGDGHLSATAAQEAGQPGRDSWVVHVPPLALGEHFRYRFHGDRCTTPWFQVRGCAWREAPTALHLSGEPRDRLVSGSVGVLTDGEQAYALRFALRLDPGARVVGFGERFNALDQRGRLVDAIVFDQYKAQGARTYLPVPFAHVVGAGFGFHVDTARRVRFDVGASEADRVLVHVDLEPGVREPELTLRLFAGSPAEVLDAFLTATARPALPPPWVHRLWLSGNEWNTQARILAEVDRALAEEIPIGVLVIEAWSDEETFTTFNGARYPVHRDGAPHRLADFDFPADGPWPDPKRLVDELHRRGIKVLLWQIPLIGSHPGQAEADIHTMVERGYCLREGDGEPYRNPGGWFHDALIVDFANPEACRWWMEKRRYLVEEFGVDGFKTDGGEHAWSSELRYADGTRGGETNSRYPVLYGQAYHDLLRSAGREPVTFSRSGFTGSAAVPCHWAGDEDSTWEGFRASISAGLTAGASGIFFWGWDLAGFSGPLPTPELYLRAAAMAALCPLMQLHSEHGCPDRTPWNIAEQSGDPSVVPRFRRFARLRERLVPYLAEQAARAVADGKPLMRALFFEAEDDEQIWSFPEQYFLGNDLLVAPVTRETADRQPVYLPAGEWVDAWSGERYAGPTTVEREVPLELIPAFIVATRASELAPLFANLDDEATHSVAEPMEVR